MFLQTAQQPSIFTIWPFLLVFAIFYLIVILPNRRNQKKVQEMIQSLKVGDKVITNGGIYGTIAGLKGDRIQLRIAENVKIEMSRSAVTALQTEEQANS